MTIDFRKDGPWELPQGWVWARLGDLGRWSGGGTPSKSNPTFWEGGTIPWVSPKDMKVGVIDETVDTITTDAVAKSSTKMIPSNSVLMVVRSGILEHTFPVAVCAREVTLNQDMRALTPHSGIDPHFLLHLLKRLQRDILDECSKDGTTVASVEPAKLEAMWVPIAPTTEQRRVVLRIEELFADITDGETALARVRSDSLKATIGGGLTAKLRQAILRTAFEGRLVDQDLSEEPAQVMLERISVSASVDTSLPKPTSRRARAAQ
jgi:type I restriction enzyme S subunit